MGSQGTREVTGMHVMSAGMVTFSILILGVLTLYLLNVCNALCVLIDAFCCEVFASTDLDDDFFDKWNKLQALARYTSKANSRCFLGLSATMFISPLLTVLQFLFSDPRVSDVLIVLAPQLLWACIVTHLWFRAAEVSWKCDRLPAFVNSLPLDIERRRQAIDYIIHSGAGFFVGDIRVTPAMISRGVYVSCIGAASILSKVAMDS